MDDEKSVAMSVNLYDVDPYRIVSGGLCGESYRGDNE
jgi:hypothetical protein